LLASCATTRPAQTTSIEPTYRVRSGVIESVDKVEEHVASDASDTVLIGLFVGGLLFSGLLLHRGTGPVVGAEEGNTAVASGGGVSSRLPHYRVVVRFDDGVSMTLVYTNDVAFHRGERVMLTRQGLVGAEPMRPKAIAER
jgi:outer membrane lipoprotein SlyB